MRPDHSTQHDLAEYWVRKVQSIRRFTKGNKRAPYKPLLLLWLIGKLAERPYHPEQSTRFLFGDVEDELIELMEKHRMGNTRVRVQYPFAYLASDKDLWIAEDSSHNNVVNLDEVNKQSAKYLRDNRVSGGPTRAFEEALQNEEVRSRVVNALLHMEFPDTRHEEMLADVNLRERVTVQRVRRDPYFAIVVLKAYGYRCSFCGFSAHLGEAPVGIDAAHVQMVKHGGPDSVSNGLALCVLHHRLFDRGALGLDQDYRILVSQRLAIDDDEASVPTLRLAGTQMRSPQNKFPPPDRPRLIWHRENLFAEPAR